MRNNYDSRPLRLLAHHIPRRPGDAVAEDRLLDKVREMNKFHARKTEIGGIVFDSAAEARRWQELTLMQKTGDITDLQRQVVYKLVVNGQLICKYIADFQYKMVYEVDGIKRPGKAWFVEDVKGVRTPVYRLKKKLLAALYGIEIIEVES